MTPRVEERLPAGLSGTVEHGWGPLAELVATRIAEFGSGAALTVTRGGTTLIDVWGGIADPATGRPWTRDTPMVIFSCSKGLLALLVALAHERGTIDIDRPLVEVWPEFGAHGKGSITLGHVLAHRAGLSALRDDVSLEDALDSHRMARIIAAEKPLWKPDTGHAYHALTLGWIVAEVLRRTDGREIGELLHAELGAIAGDPIWLGFPQRLTNERARMRRPERPPLSRPPTPGPELWAERALTLGGALPLWRTGDGTGFDDPEILEAGIPAASIVTTARALSRTWAAVADGRLLQPATLDLMSRERSGGASIMGEPEPWPRWGAGVQLDSSLRRLTSARAFGHDGLGGQLGFADPATGIGFGFVSNALLLDEDPRTVELVQALRDLL